MVNEENIYEVSSEKLVFSEPKKQYIATRKPTSLKLKRERHDYHKDAMILHVVCSHDYFACLSYNQLFLTVPGSFISVVSTRPSDLTNSRVYHLPRHIFFMSAR